MHLSYSHSPLGGSVALRISAQTSGEKAFPINITETTEGVMSMTKRTAVSSI